MFPYDKDQAKIRNCVIEVENKMIESLKELK